MARETQVTPTHWSSRGEALATVRGKPALVWGGIPGERSFVHLIKEGQNRDYYRFRGTRSPSEHRVTPPCTRYVLCGGCPLMHLDEEGQLHAKRELVLDAFEDEGLTDVNVGNVIASPDGTEDFRHVVKLGVGYSDKGSLRVGAWGRNTRSIVPIPHCNVATATLRTLMGRIAHFVREFDIWPYDYESDRGVLRAFVLRQSRDSGLVHVTIVAAYRKRILSLLAEEIGADSKVSGVSLHLNAEEGNAIFVRNEEGEIPTRPLMGRPYIEETLNGITYEVGPGDFFQTNPSVAEKLYRDTLDRLEVSDQTPFLDLYCGVGGLALPAAKRAGWALGIETVAGAVKSARNAAKAQKIPAEFMVGDVGEVLPDLKRRLGGSRPIISVNPARRGLEDGVIDAIHEMKPRKIAYISCNPKALARDLTRLKELGYAIGQVELYDMFPNTPHVESVVILESADQGGPQRRAPRRRVVGRRGKASK